jgi:hypothetical protein
VIIGSIAPGGIRKCKIDLKPWFFLESQPTCHGINEKKVSCGRKPTHNVCCQIGIEDVRFLLAVMTTEEELNNA